MEAQEKAVGTEGMEVDERRFYKVYDYKTHTAIFFKNLPHTEALALLDVSSSSRISPKPGDMLRDRLMQKSDDMFSGLYPDTSISVGEALENEPEALEKNVRASLYRIKENLGSRNISEQSHAMIALVTPIHNVMLMQMEMFNASQERSTRYVKFEEMYVPQFLPKSGGSEEKSERAMRAYVETLSKICDTHNKAFDIISLKYVAKFEQENGRQPTESELRDKIYPSVRDYTRALLPTATKTIVFFSDSERTFESMTKKLYATGNPTNIEVADLLAHVCRENMPSLSAHMNADQFDKEIAKMTRKVVSIDEAHEWHWLNTNFMINWSGTTAEARLIGEASQTEGQMLATIAYWISGRDMNYYGGPENDKRALEYLSISQNREGKWDEFTDSALAATKVSFEIKVDIGTMRDLIRHRLATKTHFITQNEYILPKLISEDADAMPIIKDAFEHVSESTKLLNELGYGEEAKLLMPMATKATLKMTMSLAEAIFIIEQRSTKEAHWEYKQIALQMFDELKKNYPEIMKGLKLFVGDNRFQPESQKNYTEYSRSLRSHADEVSKILN